MADATWEAPILSQVGGIELDKATIAQVVAVLGSAQRPVAIDRARIERQMRDLALEHAAGGVADGTYLVRMGELRSQLASVDEGSNTSVSAERAVAWLRALGETWHQADAPQAKADLVYAIYERIVVAGPTFVSARLTPAAYAHGLALALPQVVRARPEGFEPPTLWSEATCSSPLSYGRAEGKGSAGAVTPPGRVARLEGHRRRPY